MSAVASVIAPRRAGALPLYYLIFTLSGFAGLIYESIWSHYLKLLLGHAAYAQTVVLAIFMGGLALGSWWAGRRTARWSRLLLGYAAAEAAIGVAALVFHPLFVTVSAAFVAFTERASLDPLTLDLLKWSLAALLIAPQSCLLGMTFPLLSAGLLRGRATAPGRTLATLYCLNSLGATVGVLASGLWLVGAIGLPGTIALAGVINLLLAAVVWLLESRVVAPPPAPAVMDTPTSAPPRLLLGVAALTGLSSFVYELCWIRMLSMVLGAATHSFELMLSAFILGLALGGWWIRRRIDAITDLIAALALLQLAMGVAALVSIALYARAFDGMAWLLGALSRTPAGYDLFLSGSHALALFLMLPATFCAGTTLPLLTHALLRAGHGERAIGGVYAANTLGAIVGVLFTVHVALPALGLRDTLALGAALDLALGALLLAIAGGSARWRPWGAAAGGAALVALTMYHVPFDVRRMASGVYRHGQATVAASATSLFHADGKTASIDVLGYPNGVRAILTNGKPDAALNPPAATRPSPDEVTMVLAGALPLALHPTARSAANIGFGSGLTTATLLASAQLERVDSIEIEAQMVAGARHFLPRVAAAYEDPRSHIVIDDAKSYFAARRSRYDVIVSEPSNPWVSGVASLFSEEFYALVDRYLAPGGVLVQWLQLYEFDTPLLASVVDALATRFPHYAIYQTDDANILIVASRLRSPAALSAQVFASAPLARELARVGVRDLADLHAHRVAGDAVLTPLLASYRAPRNSDYHPYVDQQAPRARYLRGTALAVLELRHAPLPLLEMLDPDQGPPAAALSADMDLRHARDWRGARSALAALEDPAAPPPRSPAAVRDAVLLLRSTAARCTDAGLGERAREAVLVLANEIAPALAAGDNARLWSGLAHHACLEGDATAARWLEFHAAAGARDAGRLRRVALDLLAAPGQEHDPQRHGLLVAGAMLGALAAGDAAGALATWRDHRAPAWRPDSVNVFLRTLLTSALFRAATPAP